MGQIIIFQAEHKIPEQGREKEGGNLLRSEGWEGAVFASFWCLFPLLCP